MTCDMYERTDRYSRHAHRHIYVGLFSNETYVTCVYHTSAGAVYYLASAYIPSLYKYADVITV